MYHTATADYTDCLSCSHVDYIARLPLRVDLLCVCVCVCVCHIENFDNGWQCERKVLSSIIFMVAVLLLYILYIHV